MLTATPSNRDGRSAVATMEFEVEAEEAGVYEVLLRYEAAYRFETPVKLVISPTSAKANPTACK